MFLWSEVDMSVDMSILLSVLIYILFDSSQNFFNTGHTSANMWLTDFDNLRYLKYKLTYKQNTKIHINKHMIFSIRQIIHF